MSAPKMLRSIRSTLVRSTARFTGGTVAISFSAAARGISATTAPSGPASTVAPRRRPAISTISPKIWPVASGTVILGLFGSTCTAASPSTTAKREVPMSLRVMMRSPRFKRRTWASSMNSRICSGETGANSSTRDCR